MTPIESRLLRADSHRYRQDVIRRADEVSTRERRCLTTIDEMSRIQVTRDVRAAQDVGSTGHKSEHAEGTLS